MHSSGPPTQDPPVLTPTTMKRSACIEGSRITLARVKAYWAEMYATTVAAQGSAIGRVAVEHYFEEVLEGAHSIEAQCSKNIMFE